MHEAFAADGPVTATLDPTQITLTPYSANAVTLVIANAGPGSATNLVITPTPSDASITVASASTGATPTTIPAMSSVSLTYNVTRQIEGTGQDVAVLFVVSYVQSATGDSGLVVPILTVKAAASLPVVDAKIQSNVTNINENRPGEGALVITNPREAVIDISSIQVTAPNFVDVTLHCRSVKGDRDLAVPGGTTAVFNETRCKMTVDPRSEQILHMGFTTTDTVAPGPRTVVVEVTATDTDTHASASSVATLGLTVDIFAESDVLKSLGVPIFLLLPGFIVVVIVQALLSFVGPKNFGASASTSNTTVLGKLGSLVLAKSPEVKSASNADAKSPSNPVSAAASTIALGLVASVIFSLFIAKIYPWLTLHGPPFHARNYVVAYGFRDIYYAIAYSLAIGLAIWMALVVLSPVDRSLDALLRVFWRAVWKQRRVEWWEKLTGNLDGGGAEPPPPPRVSDDGNFYLDGSHWVPFQQPRPPVAQKQPPLREEDDG